RPDPRARLRAQDRGGNATRGAARSRRDRGVPGGRVVTSLVWEGCLNVRDLGGLPTADGGTTQLGAIVRSDNVNVLTTEGWRALADHGVVRIVDLRWPEELEGEGPPSADVEIVHVSLLGEAFDEEYVAELDASLDAVSDVAEHYAWSYVDFLERFRDRFGLA